MVAVLVRVSVTATRFVAVSVAVLFGGEHGGVLRCCHADPMMMTHYLQHGYMVVQLRNVVSWDSLLEPMGLMGQSMHVTWHVTMACDACRHCQHHSMAWQGKAIHDMG